MGRTIRRIISALSALSLAAFIASGCSSAEKSTRQDEPARAESDITKFEKDFRPSDYLHPRSGEAQRGKDSLSAMEKQGESPAGSGEMVQGFRVQVFSTSNIDEANAKKSEAELVFPNEWLYLQYDPPAYKIRAGNFLTKVDAEKFREDAAERGFRGAWIVPERVFKNPPPLPPRVEPPPQKK